MFLVEEQYNLEPLYLSEYPANKQLTVLESSFFSYGIYGRASVGQPQKYRCL